MQNYSTTVAINSWQTDGDFNAKVIRLSNTGAANTDYLLDNPLGRDPVGIQIIKQNKACDIIFISSSRAKIIVQFSADNADLNIRVW